MRDKMSFQLILLVFTFYLDFITTEEFYSEYPQEVDSTSANNKSRRNIVDILSYTNRHRLIFDEDITSTTESIPLRKFASAAQNHQSCGGQNSELIKLRSPRVKEFPDNTNLLLKIKGISKQADLNRFNLISTVNSDKSKVSTQSYIEFYYLDESNNNDNVKTKYFHDFKNRITNFSDIVNTGYGNNQYIESETSTLHDKVRFFEIYDKETEKPVILNNSLVQDYFSENIDLIEQLKIQGKKGDIDILQHNSTNINDFDGNSTTTLKALIEVNIKNTSSNNQTNANIYDNDLGDKFNDSINFTKEPLKQSIAASWSDFPFAAVYVYEQLQVHCDAAAISRHWLISSGACLARHKLRTHVEGPSAFVTYCGPYWQYPERITYVKYTIIHPKFNPRDKIRRQLYNIALIQVVGSMETSCKGWSPASLVTHRFTAAPGGYLGIAVGWGVDRYGTKYKSSDLPQRPMMVYDALVYSDYCPGVTNIRFVKTSSLLETTLKNLLCLSLPPYLGEEKDPVHGGLLLVGGKLVGLYLQEIRRIRGEQSAQYTGIWELIPWVVETATESDEHDLLYYSEK